MAVAITGTPNVQSNTASASDKTLTFASDTYGADEVLVVVVAQNSDNNAMPTPGVPSGGGLTWTQIANSQGTGTSFIRATGWWATTGAGGTYSVTQTTTRGTSTGLSTRGVLYRLTGANITAPAEATDTYNAVGGTDPLTSNTNLQLTTASADSMLFVCGVDYQAIAGTVAFDSGLTATTDINAVEAAHATFYAFRSDALGADDTDVRAQMDETGGSGEWASVFFEIEAASGGPPPPGLLVAPTVMQATPSMPVPSYPY